MSPDPIYGSDESIDAFVQSLYRIVLGREADPGGRANYVAELKRAKPVAELIQIFLNSPEYKEKKRREVLEELSGEWSRPAHGGERPPVPEATWATDETLFPPDYNAPGEAGKSYQERIRTGFLQRYCSGPLVLDVGYTGYDNPENKTAFPHALGVDFGYPGYDGLRLPFGDGTVDAVFSSHCLEHITLDHAVIRDWHRVLKVGGFIICIVPSQALYEKRRFLPSAFNADHKRMYTASSLAGAFDVALEPNSYKVRHLAENDRHFDYTRGPELHSGGCYEIEIVVEKIASPAWTLA